MDESISGSFCDVTSGLYSHFWLNLAGLDPQLRTSNFWWNTKEPCGMEQSRSSWKGLSTSRLPVWASDCRLTVFTVCTNPHKDSWAGKLPGLHRTRTVSLWSQSLCNEGAQFLFRGTERAVLNRSRFCPVGERATEVSGASNHRPSMSPTSVDMRSSASLRSPVSHSAWLMA